MVTRLAGDVSITYLEVKIQLAAENARFLLTLNADPGNFWRYNLSEDSHNARNSRVAVASRIRCKSTGAVPGFVIRLGDGADNLRAVGGLGGGHGAWP